MSSRRICAFSGYGDGGAAARIADALVSVDLETFGVKRFREPARGECSDRVPA